MTSTTPACDHCVHYHQTDAARSWVETLRAIPEEGLPATQQTLHEPSRGQCREQSPRVVGAKRCAGSVDFFTRWPAVNGNHWCGRFKASQLADARQGALL